MARIARVPVIAFLVVASAVARRAQAADPKADALVNRAVELRRGGDDQGALELLLAAYAMDHTPRATGQLGFCEQALGRWADAEVYLTEALRAETDAWVEKNRRTLEDALVVVRAHVARVEIDGEPAGAEVWVNGVLVGKVPLGAPIRVAAGENEIELRAPGYVRETKTMQLEAGQYRRVVLRASREVVPLPPAAATPGLPPASAPPPAAAEAATKASPSPRRPLYKWVALGVGAAAVGVGVYGAVENARLVSSFDGAGCFVDSTGRAVDRTGVASGDCASRKSDYEAMSHLAIGGFIAGGVLVATGLVLWLTEPAARPGETAALTCAPSPTARRGAGVVCSLRF